MTYEVQTLTFLNNWENTWTDNDGTPSQFDNYAEAAAELTEFLDDLASAAERNFLADFNPSDYRIVKND
jgi:hypothetical protein